jgi:glutathione synthase/RimK-type ligase-like ATP-grasp enzyme
MPPARVFVKLSCSSSASCLCIYDPQNDSLVTTIERAHTGWYNSRKLRRARGKGAAEILAFLIREGSQIEEEVEKARVDGRWFDCRVLAVAGEPAFTVVRTSPHRITNLHLGGTRGDPDDLPSATHAVMMATCRRVAAAHDCLHVGIDVMIEKGWRGVRVLEANAFGDLLPNLRRDGLDVYEWQIRAALQDS